MKRTAGNSCGALRVGHICLPTGITTLVSNNNAHVNCEFRLPIFEAASKARIQILWNTHCPQTIGLRTMWKPSKYWRNTRIAP